MLIKKIKALFKIDNESGMAIIEVIIIMIILGIAVFPLSRLSVTNFKSASAGQDITRALLYAQEIMENIMADYNSPDPTIGGYENVRTRWPGTPPGTPPQGLSGTVYISGELQLNGVTYVVVKVSVSLQSLDNKVELTSWIVK